MRRRTPTLAAARPRAAGGSPFRHRTLAVGATLALAVTGANAASSAAAPPQSIHRSVAAAQVGSVSAHAPIRVASDGDNGRADSGQGPGVETQSTDRSAGVAQVGSADVSAPVRVASDGNDQGGSGQGSGADETIDRSMLAIQIGSLDVGAPARVAGDGDDRGSDQGAGAGPQAIDRSLGAAQVGSVSGDAPIRVASDGDDQSGSGAGSSAETETIHRSVLAVQIGSLDARAPARVASDSDGRRDSGDRRDNGGGAPVSCASRCAPDEQVDGGGGGERVSEQQRSGGRPAARWHGERRSRDEAGGLRGSEEANRLGVGSGGELQPAVLSQPAAQQPVADAARGAEAAGAGELPFSGLALWLLLLVGGALVAGGVGACSTMSRRGEVMRVAVS
jgi:hypothetical protein